MSRAFVDKLSAAGSVAAAGLGATMAFRHLAADSKSLELLIAVASTAAALVAGTLSLYIARGAKRLSQKQRIFISYSHEEKDRARQLRDALSDHGAKVWFDENELQPGTDLRSAISAAIESSNTVVAVVSTRMGPHLGAELRAAFDRGVPVFALVSGDDQRPEFLRGEPEIRYLAPEQDLNKVAATLLGNQEAAI